MYPKKSSGTAWAIRSVLLSVLGCTPVVVQATEPDKTNANDLEEIVVVAARQPTQIYKTGRAITSLDENQIDNLGYEYAADLFRFVPGVAVNRTGGYGGNTQLRIRGAENNHSVVLIDGIDVSSAGSGEFDLSSLLSAEIERIEVLRGPQSGLYGSNALGGVVNILTRAPEEGFELRTEMEAGSDDARHGAVSITAGNDMLRGRLTYVQRQSEFDLSNDDSLIGSEDDEDQNRTLSGKVQFDASDKLTFELSGRHTKKDTDTDGFDFSGGPRQGLAIDDNSYSNTEDFTLGAVGTASLAEGRSITRLSMATTETEIRGRSWGSEAERDEVRLDTSWRWRSSNNLQQRTTAYVHWEEESFRNTVPLDPSQAPEQTRDLLGFGLEHRIEIDDAFFINANLRQDNNDDFDDSTTYSIDVSYRVADTGTRLHASYGRAVTNPTFFEQFGFVPGSFVGNPSLQPEQSTGWDAGIEQKLLDNSLLIDISYFDADLTDEIQAVFPSVLNASGQSERSGAELSMSWKPAANTSINATYTYTDADEPGGEEVRRPRHMASAGIARRLLNGRLQVAGSALYNGAMLDNDFRNFFTNGFVSQRTELDSYVLINLKASFRVTDALQVYVRLANLFDEDYEESISYATPGRSIFAGLKYRLRS